MLVTREAIREDKSFALLTDAILERDQPRTTDLFFQMVKRQGRSVGDVRRSYGLFLGLAEDPEIRPMLRDQLLFLGLIDLQDTVVGRKARNTGHKALRARAVLDLADVLGWERAHGVYYMGVPDMAIRPLYYSLYDAVCVRMASEFPDGGVSLKETNQTLLSPAEVENMVRLLMEADADAVWDLCSARRMNRES